MSLFLNFNLTVFSIIVSFSGSGSGFRGWRDSALSFLAVVEGEFMKGGSLLGLRKVVRGCCCSVDR